MENPELWYPVNKRGGKWLLATSLCALLAAVGFSLIPGITLDVYALSILGVVVVVPTIAMVDTFRYINSL